MKGVEIMKFEWRKKEKNLYLPKEKADIIEVPIHKFIMIEGKGNPNNQEFADKVAVLYSVAYGIRMMPKKGITPEGYFEYTVYPLEGIWDLTESAKELDYLNKDELVYQIMIRQPDFVDEKVFSIAMEQVEKKKPSKYLSDVKFITIEDGLSVQMMHVGSYDDEAKTFKLMDDFIKENNLERVEMTHREIYLSDARKVEKSKLKTVLRYRVKRK
jgi:hypothetical protein